MLPPKCVQLQMLKDSHGEIFQRTNFTDRRSTCLVLGTCWWGSVSQYFCENVEIGHAPTTSTPEPSTHVDDDCEARTNARVVPCELKMLRRTVPSIAAVSFRP
jgi:hypothetical protein